MQITEAIKTVQAHMSKDVTLPVLNTIHVTDDGYMEATDRYTVARARLDAGISLPPGLYSPAAIKILLAGGTTDPDREGDFPPVARLFPTSDVKPADFTAGPVAFNPAFLARFAPTKTPGKKDALVLTPGETPRKPWLVTVNGVDRDEWQAMITPIRMGNER